MARHDVTMPDYVDATDAADYAYDDCPRVRGVKRGSEIESDIRGSVRSL